MSLKRVPHPNHIAVPKNFCRLPFGYGVVKIGVSGSADTSHFGLEALEKGKEIGREIARQGGITVTGATTGFPLFAAMGAKDECGFVVGISPAATEREHVETYGLPLDYTDVIIYTGFGYAGRDLLFVRSSDAMIIGPGRIGTIHEFTISYEDQKPIGILEAPGIWDTDEVIKMIMSKSHRVNKKVIFDKDPKSLVERLKKMIDEDQQSMRIYKSDDHVNEVVADSNRIL